MTQLHHERIAADHLTQSLGLLIDKAENYLAYRDAHMPPILRCDAYELAIQDLRDELRALYFATGGADVWDQP